MVSSTQLLLSVWIFAVTSDYCNAFVPVQLKQTFPSSSLITLSAKKGKKSPKGKGFAKSPPPSTSTPSNDSEETTEPTSAFGLQSIDSAKSNSNAITDSPALNSKLNKPIDIDENASAEERAEQILRQRFGMRSFEEDQYDIVKAQKIKEAKERTAKLKKLAAIDDGSFDIFMVLPTGLVKFIDAFLKIGLGISVILFILAGVGITLEAYAASSGNPLPTDLDDFIVNVVEPNFTPGLLVLLGFSVSLGLFASAQLGSAASQYQEKP